MKTFKKDTTVYDKGDLVKVRSYRELVKRMGGYNATFIGDLCGKVLTVLEDDGEGTLICTADKNTDCKFSGMTIFKEEVYPVKK